eukprot:272210_1
MQTKHSVYAIGSNSNGQCGVGHSNAIDELTELGKIQKFRNIVTGYDWFICSDDKNNYFAAGSNRDGQLGLGMCSKQELEFKQIKYFKNNNVKIKKVFASNYGWTTFWLTENDEIYGCGHNRFANLGLGDKNARNQPTLIKELKNVIDIKVGPSYSLALCRINDDMDYNKIINFYNDNKNITNDITKLIKKFIGDFGCVYST